MFVSVHRPKLHHVPEFVEDGVRYIHGIGTYTATEHANCHDGQHLRARDWAKREGVGEASKYVPNDIINWWSRGPTC